MWRRGRVVLSDSDIDVMDARTWEQQPSSEPQALDEKAASTTVVIAGGGVRLCH
jgi:hypothetical protein